MDFDTLYIKNLTEYGFSLKTITKWVYGRYTKKNYNRVCRIVYKKLKTSLRPYREGRTTWSKYVKNKAYPRYVRTRKTG